MIPTYCQGDSVALLFTIDQSEQTLDKFEIEAAIFRKPNTLLIKASTTPNSGEIPIITLSPTQWGFNILEADSIMLNPADYSVQTTYRHKASGVVRSLTNPLFTVTKKI